MFNLSDIPEELFKEIEIKPKNLTPIDIDLYESNCPELMGNMILELYKNDKNCFYMIQKIREPIGDYGYRWVNTWYQCLDSDEVKRLYEEATK